MARFLSLPALTSIVLFSATITASAIQTSNVCKTNTCQQWSKFLKESLHPKYTTLDPCEDFDKYTCTGWRAHNNFRPEQSDTTVMTVMQDVNQKLLRTVLEGQYSSKLSGPNRTYDEQNFNKMKVSYRTCMDETTIKSKGIGALQKMLKEAENDIPTVALNSDSASQLTKAMASMRRRNVDLFAGSEPTVSTALVNGPCLASSNFKIRKTPKTHQPR